MNKNKKHYLIYQTTNLINGKIYIGKHITTNIEDEYFGSGNLIRAAINKYGLENFIKTILFELQNEEEMNLLEKCVVTQEFCDREDTYNINVGGDGGWSYVNYSSDYAVGSQRRLQFHSKGGKACQQQYKEKYGSLTKYYYAIMDDETREKRRQLNSSRAKQISAFNWKGKHHTQETKKKISASHKGKFCGKDNSMFNNVWIKNNQLKLSIVWNKDLDIPDGWEYGRCLNFEKQSQQIAENNMYSIEIIEHNKKETMYKELFFTLMYQFYLKFGYKQMIEKFQISMSQSSFCHMCKKYVKEYFKWKRWKQF